MSQEEFAIADNDKTTTPTPTNINKRVSTGSPKLSSDLSRSSSPIQKQQQHHYNRNHNNDHHDSSFTIQPGMMKASLLVTRYIINIRKQFKCINNNNLNDIKCEECICGYHTNIPLAIINIITIYYPKMNGKLYIWHIFDPNIIKNFINAKHKQRFASDIFEMKNLKWYLSCYPNGDRKIGSCTVYLTLISFPIGWSKFICNYSIYCHQTRSSATYITTYTEKRAQSGRIAGLLSIKEIRGKYLNNLLNSITFSVNVNILQIYDKSITKSLIYSYNLSSSLITKSKRFVIVWNVNNYLLKQFLESDAIKQYETDIFYDMFCLAFCPNGGWLENQGQARLSLKLCSLPNTISKIKVKMELLCIETETYYSDICDFSYDSKNTVRAWPSDILLTPQLNGLNKLTFKAQIVIIAKYDKNGNEINNNNINNNIQWNYNHQKRNRNRNRNRNRDNINDNHILSQINLIKKNELRLDKIDNKIKNINISLDKYQNKSIQQVNCKYDNDNKSNINNSVSINEQNKQLKYWLNNIVKLGEYYDLFIKNGIDSVDIVKQLSMDELISIGITKVGHRKKLKTHIDNLNNITLSKIFWLIFPK